MQFAEFVPGKPQPRATALAGYDPRLEPLRVMLEGLELPQRELLARKLHEKLHAPPSAADGRWPELGLLASVIGELPQPPERLPYVERQIYEDRRRLVRGGAPALQLVKRHGSWKRACYAAWGLLPDGRNAFGGQPWHESQQGKPVRVPFTESECIQSLRKCASAIAHVPTSREYHRWRQTHIRNARARGKHPRLATVNAILRKLARDRLDHGDGWRIVTERVFGAR
jgi:hypothetical protein